MILRPFVTHIEKDVMTSELLIEPTATKDVDEMLREVYEPGFYAVARFVGRRGGTLDDAKDIFQEAFALMYEQLEQGLQIESPVRYLTGIAKNLWYQEIRTRTAEAPLTAARDTETEVPKKLDDTRLLALLERAGKRCMDLLEAFYFRKDGLHTIASVFGFSSGHSASVQKYKCIEKLRNELKTKSLTYEDFFE